MANETERLAFLGIVFTAVGALLTKILEPFARRLAANVRAKPATPGEERLTAARADELMQQAYSRLFGDLQEERDRLAIRVGELESKVSVLEAERVLLRSANADQQAKIAQLLLQIAEQQKEIERLLAEIIRLRKAGNGGAETPR